MMGSSLVSLDDRAERRVAPAADLDRNSCKPAGLVRSLGACHQVWR
jgi:hypothetical protein